jgi:hypothetical protein
MEQDEVIREVRAIREAYAEKFGNDIGALFRDAREREATTNRQIVSLEPKKLETTPRG